MLFYFCKRLGKEILIEDWKVTINRGLGSVSKSYHTCVRAVFRIDFDSSLFDGLLIRTLFHRCAQCFVDMILFDPTSPSVKSYQLVEVVSGGRAPGKSSSLASPQLLVIGRFHCFGAVRLEKVQFLYCVDL